MVRILGNSIERVELKDMNDIVYYRQVKEFTDQECEDSKDLKKALQKGRLVKLDQNKASRGSGDSGIHQIIENHNLLNLMDLKTALREVLPEFKNNGVSENSVKNAMREVIPLFVDMVRQEISKISITKEEVKKTTSSSKFVDPTYVPTISDTGLKSNIKVKEKEISGDSMAGNLAALRQFKKK